MKLAYLGPAGTFTGEVAHKVAEEQNGELESYSQIDAVIMAVSRGDADLGVVPVENSLEGSVNLTLDMLGQTEAVQVVGERVFPIRHSLLATPGTRIKDIELVYSHPQSLAQCRGYLRNNLPEIQEKPCSSNAEAFMQARQTPQAAAIGFSKGGLQYGLLVLEEGIQDENANYTRFLLLGKEVTGVTGKDKTSLLLALKDEAGSLYRLLGHFARQNINLTKIESRPSRKKLGEYLFFLDFEGHREEENIARLLQEIENEALSCRVLGSYPRAF